MKSLGNRISDKMAQFAGSWTFIILFAAILIGWIIYNTEITTFLIFDPYPFILLNLFLSCLAAIQAPIILMAQNRQEAKDRKKSMKHDELNRLMEAKLDRIIRRLEDES